MTQISTGIKRRKLQNSLISEDLGDPPAPAKRYAVIVAVDTLGEIRLNKVDCFDLSEAEKVVKDFTHMSQTKLKRRLGGSLVYYGLVEILVERTF